MSKADNSRRGSGRDEKVCVRLWLISELQSKDSLTDGLSGKTDCVLLFITFKDLDTFLPIG